MNKKSNKNQKYIFIGLILILVLSYIYINLPNDFNIQLGGSGKPSLPPTCLPMMYRYRFIIYIIPIILISLNIFYGLQTSKVASYTYADYGRIFLAGFAKQTNVIAGNPEDPNDPAPNLQEVYDEVIDQSKPQKFLGTYVDSFCTTLAPISCCNVPGYKYQSRCPGSNTTSQANSNPAGASTGN